MRTGCRSSRAITSPLPRRWTRSRCIAPNSSRRERCPSRTSWSRPTSSSPTTPPPPALASSYGQWVYSIRAGDGAIPYPDPDNVEPLTDAQRDVVKDRTATQFVGDPDEVADKLETLQRVADGRRTRHHVRHPWPRRPTALASADRRALGTVTRRRQAAQADSPRRALPRRQQHHGVVRSRLGQPDRVRLVRPPRPHRRTRAVRLLLPRRGSAAA